MRFERSTSTILELPNGSPMHLSLLYCRPNVVTTASDQIDLGRLAPTHGRSNGFTLIELMIVVLISAILAMIAIPSFQEFLAKSRVNGSVNLLTTSFDLARSEALSRNRVTVVCKSADPMAVVPVCIDSASGDFEIDDWAIGWIIYSKPADFNSAASTAASLSFDSALDQLVRRVSPFSSGTAAKRMTIILNPNLAAIAFTPAGIRLNAAAAEPIITVDFRVKTDPIALTTAKCISLNLLGRSSVYIPATTC